MIAITDYDTGNLRSVANALRRIGAEFTVTSDAAVLRQADRVLLPGVGEASSAMAKLRERGLDALIPTLTQPVLGICIGMQLMCLDSEEGDTRCLGIFPAHVVRLRGGENPLKIPHVGWDTVGRLRSPLFDDLGEGTYLYYVHSYAAQACDATIAQTDYGGIFSAALGRGNFFGTQFHPEKSPPHTRNGGSSIKIGRSGTLGGSHDFLFQFSHGTAIIHNQIQPGLGACQGVR